MAKVKGEEFNLESLAKAISWLDGYRACYCVNPSRIEDVVRKYPKRDVRKLWREVKSDIYKIASLPTSSPEIVRMYKIVTISRSLLPIFAVLSLTMWIVTIEIKVPGLFGSLFSILLILSLGTVVFYYGYNKRLYNKIRMYYNDRLDALKERRRRIKNITQVLINGLAHYIKGRKYDPREYDFSLFHLDYDNIKVVEKKGSKKFLSKIKFIRSFKEKKSHSVIVKTQG